jgi:hypothetical protein
MEELIKIFEIKDKKEMEELIKEFENTHKNYLLLYLELNSFQENEFIRNRILHFSEIKKYKFFETEEILIRKIIQTILENKNDNLCVALESILESNPENFQILQDEISNTKEFCNFLEIFPKCENSQDNEALQQFLFDFIIKNYSSSNTNEKEIMLKYMPHCVFHVPNMEKIFFNLIKSTFMNENEEISLYHIILLENIICLISKEEINEIFEYLETYLNSIEDCRIYVDLQYLLKEGIKHVRFNYFKK